MSCMLLLVGVFRVVLAARQREARNAGGDMSVSDGIMCSVRDWSLSGSGSPRLLDNVSRMCWSSDVRASRMISGRVTRHRYDRRDMIHRINRRADWDGMASWFKLSRMGAAEWMICV